MLDTQLKFHCNRPLHIALNGWHEIQQLIAIESFAIIISSINFNYPNKFALAIRRSIYKSTAGIFQTEPLRKPREVFQTEHLQASISKQDFLNYKLNLGFEPREL